MPLINRRGVYFLKIFGVNEETTVQPAPAFLLVRLNQIRLVIGVRTILEALHNNNMRCR